MNVFETIRTALESLTSNKLRTVLTMLGVIIGVGSVVALLSIGAGAAGFITGRIQGIGSNLLTISTSFQNSNARLTNSDVTALSDPLNVPELTGVVAEVRGNAKLSEALNTTTMNTSILGEMPDFFRIRNISVSDGSLIVQNDLDLRSRVAVIGSVVASTLFPNGGAVGQTIVIGSTPFKVAGVATSVGGSGPTNTDDQVYVPLTVAQEKLFVNRSGGLKSVSTIYAEVASTDVTQAAMDDISTVLRQQHNLIEGQADDFRVFNQAQVAQTLDAVASALTAFLGVIGGISLLVGGIGIMNIMLVSVTERTREIGVRKAMGAKRRNILSQFLVEALTVSCIAGLIGVVFGIGASDVVGKLQTTLVPHVQLDTILISFGFSALIGIVFGLYPAWRASRLEPVEALRFE